MDFMHVCNCYLYLLVMTKKLLMVTQTVTTLMLIIDEGNRCSSCSVGSSGFCGVSNELGDYVTKHADK
jgi:hypothetical protein